MLTRALLCSAVAAVCAGCSSIPDTTYRYYQPKSATTFSVTQNLQCIKAADASASNSKKSKPKVPAYTGLDITTTIATPTTSYFADYTEPATPVSVRDIDTPLSDTDVSFSFTEDGRLSSMNATVTGEGQTILQSAISLGSSIASIGAAAGFLGRNGELPPTANDVCNALSNYPNSDKLALTFTRVVDVGRAAKEWLDAKVAAAASNALPPPKPSFLLNDGSQNINVSDPRLFSMLLSKQVNLPQVRVTLGDIKRNPRVASYNPTTSGDVVKLDLQDTASVRLDYDQDTRIMAASSNLVVVPLRGSIYQVAIPKGEPFGSGKVSLALATSGAITTLEYSNTNGSAGPINVATSALTAATPAATTPSSTSQ